MEIQFPNINKINWSPWPRMSFYKETYLRDFQDGSDGLLRRELLAMTVQVTGLGLRTAYYLHKLLPLLQIK